MRNLLKAGIFLTVIFIVISCGKPRSLEYVSIQNFKIGTLSLGTSVISADLKFYNPNDFRVRLRKAEMDISVNSKFIGRSTLDTLMIIPKKDSFLIPVRLNVDMKSLITNSLGSLFSNEADLKMVGRARLGKGIFYFNFPFAYEGKQQLKLF